MALRNTTEVVKLRKGVFVALCAFVVAILALAVVSAFQKKQRPQEQQHDVEKGAFDMTSAISKRSGSMKKTRVITKKVIL